MVMIDAVGAIKPKCLIITSIPRGTLITTVGGNNQQTNLSTEENNKTKCNIIYDIIK